MNKLYTVTVTDSNGATLLKETSDCIAMTINRLDLQKTMSVIYSETNAKILLSVSRTLVDLSEKITDKVIDVIGVETNMALGAESAGE